MTRRCLFACATFLSLAVSCFTSANVFAQTQGTVFILSSDTDLEVEFLDGGSTIVRRGSSVRLFEVAPNYLICYYDGKQALFPVLEMKTLEDSLVHFASCCEIDPSSKNFSIKADIEYSLRKLDAALADANRAIELDSKAPRPHFTLAGVRYLRKQYEDSNEIIDHVLELQPENPRDMAFAFSWKASLAWQLNNRDECIGYIRKAIDLAPYYSRLHANLGYFLTKNDELDKAIAAYQKSISIDPVSPDGYFRLGYLHRSAKENKKAIPLLQRAAELDPLYYYPHLNLARIAQETGDYPGYAKRMKLAALSREALLSAMFEAAWLLACDRDEAIRDGSAAKQIALRMLERPDASERDVYRGTIALAVACAELGEFESALETLEDFNGTDYGNYDLDSIREKLESGEPVRNK